MDGTPVFNLKERCLEGGADPRLPRDLEQHEQSHPVHPRGRWDSPPRPSARRKRRGSPKPTPAYDLEGWDSALKGCALANALLGASVRPVEVRAPAAYLAPGLP